MTDDECRAENARLRELLGLAHWHLTQHGQDYQHVTPPEVMERLRPFGAEWRRRREAEGHAGGGI